MIAPNAPVIAPLLTGPLNTPITASVVKRPSVKVPTVVAPRKAAITVTIPTRAEQSGPPKNLWNA